MKLINLFYIAVIGVGVVLYLFQRDLKESIVSFYGYAENKETEINFNYPVQISKIHVSPGQSIVKDAPLLEVVRIQSKLDDNDQSYKVDMVQEEKQLWQSKIEGQLKLLSAQKENELSQISQKKNELIKEQSFGLSLYEGLESIDMPEGVNDELNLEIEALDKQAQQVRHLYDQKIANKNMELASGGKPYDIEVNRLRYIERTKDEQAKIEVVITAPQDGLVGNVYCKEAEHFSSFKTLLSIYEPNPSIVKGFIQEDFITKISLNDSILVRSAKEASLVYMGKVVGLGSRIVEIPPRLRKRPDMKTYGREIITSIPRSNSFLQKEKIILELYPQKELSSDLEVEQIGSVK